MPGTADYVMTTFGVTMQVAHDYLLAHIADLGTVYQLAQYYHLTNGMLGDIAGYPAAYSPMQVVDYFEAHGIDSSMLDMPYEPYEPGY